MAGKRRDGVVVGYTKEELTDKITNFIIEEGRIPTSRDADAGTHDLPCARVFARVFGSWSEAIRVHNLPVDPRGGHNRMRQTPDGSKRQKRQYRGSKIASSKG